MELNRENRLRKATRSAFTRTFNQLKTLVEASDPDKMAVQVSYNVLEERAAELKNQDERIMQLLLDDDAEDLDSEMEGTENYQSKFFAMKISVKHILDCNKCVDNESFVNVMHNSRKFRLPKLEFRKFGDDIKDWLPFWSQFQKIDLDSDIASEDKFQYLIQATLEGSRAREVVESFPPTNENYPKAVASLKARFGREDLLVEVYVREVLKLIISAQQGKNRLTMSSLYDKLESYLRALETLGVTTEKCSAMLFPLIESCFPEEFLKAWHRSSNITQVVDAKERLNKLMEFLRSEVEGEERISLAMAGFGLKNEETKFKKKYVNNYSKQEIPTAAGLLSTSTVQDFKKTCLFCEGRHNSADCFSAQKMSISDKQKRLKDKGCCFACLKPGHHTRRCKANLRCIVCGKKHVTLMCVELKGQSNTQQDSSVYNDVTASPVENGVAMTSLTRSPKVFLQTLKVKLRSDEHEICVRALVDTGSQKSYILKDTAIKLGYVPIREETIIHSLFGGESTQRSTHKCYKVKLKSLNGKYGCNFDVLDQKVICGTILPIGKGSWLHELKKKNISLTDIGQNPEPIEILIGADVIGKLLTGRREVLSCGLVAVETYLGWTLMGKVPHTDMQDSSNMSMMVTSLFVKESDISELWRLDLIGINDPVENKSKMERDFLTKEHFLKTVKINQQGRYEVCLPWTDDRPPLPDNLSQAKKRLSTTTKRLLSDNLFEEYEAVFIEWLAEGIIEEVPSAEINSFGHYLPHRPVIKESSITTRIRPVFDASARMQNHPSLNQCLECGPNLMELIPDILFRFREKKYGVTADIKKAFLQISICIEDRDFLRFLWWENVADEKYRVFRHTRVVFGVKCSPFLLGAVIEHHIRRNLDLDPFVSQQLLKNFYVDNVVTSVDNKETLQPFKLEATELMSKGCFDLRGWECSEETAEEPGDVSSHVLGLMWNRQSDILQVNMNWLQDVNLDIISKRAILSIAHKVFDPVGFTSPVMLCPKLILQKAWKIGIHWDEEVPDVLRLEFLRWFKELHVLKDIRIPRWIGITPYNMNGCSIHTFCDASQDAYAAVVYLRIENGEDTLVFLLSAKARIAPLKSVTIPRMELLAALVGVRLTNSVVKALEWKDVNTYYWSDSTTVLTWITREENWSVFVRNRVQEIRKLDIPSSWGHVPGDVNPADLPSRGCRAKHLIETKWWEGPLWMKKPMSEWPCIQSTTYQSDAEAVEKEKMKSTCLVVESKMVEDSDWYYSHFSNYTQIVRLIGWILRFIHNCLCKRELRKSGELSAPEYSGAEKKLIRIIQKESFTGEKDESLKTLETYKDEEDIIRIKTKIIYRKDRKDFRKPIVLPSKHEVVRRLILSYHVRKAHAGVQVLLNLLREHFWILNGRKAVRAVLSRCTVCKRFTAKNLDAVTAPLPENRVRNAAVFEVAGVDMAGPLFLKGNQKAWVCLFTCAVYRAVHIELVTSLSTEAFLLALRRFVARRGRCSIIYCDNGTNFVGASNLFRALDWNRITKCGAVNYIEWKFNPPTAPWWGGWWERLIRLLKDLLKRILGKASLAYEEMITILCDCEAIINSRPLTYISERDSDLVPLSPSMFLQDIKESGVPDFDTLDHQNLNKRIKYRLTLQKNLRKRFRSEYLGLLVQKPSVKRNFRPITVGDIVLIGSDNSKRMNWPLGRISELIPGKDGEVRLARIQTSYSVLTRPVQRLYPLEVSSTDPIAVASSSVPDLVNSREPSNCKSNECVPVTGKLDKIPKITTRVGRVVKIPEKLDL